MASACEPHTIFYRRLLAVGLFLLLLVLIAGIALTASVPPVSRDALTHHLAIPKLYLKHGGMVELPDIPFSYYPMNLDLLYWAALAFGNDIVPKYIHLIFGLLTAGLIYIYLKSRIGQVFGVLGALTWMSTPIVARLASEIYVDLGVAFFGFASIYMLIRWIEEGFRYRYLAVSGIFCGLGLGTKYNALIMLAILALMVPFLRSRLSGEKGRESLKPVLLSAICFLMVSLAVFSPWMIKNWVLKQNPIYPMLEQVFNGGNKVDGEWSRTSTMVQDTSGTMAVRHQVYGEPLWYIMLAPLRVFIEGQDDSPRHFDGKLNPFYLVFAVLGLLPLGAMSSNLRMEQRIWGWFALLYILMAFLTAPIRIRYIAPALPAVVVLTMIGICRFWSFSRPMKPILWKGGLHTVLIITVVGMVAYNGAYFYERFQSISPLSYISGRVSRDSYIAARLPEYPLIVHINEQLAREDVVLGLFLGQRRYYFDREVILKDGLLKKYLHGDPAPEVIASRLHQTGISHLMVRWDLFLSWMQRELNPEERRLLEVFWKYKIHKVAESGGFYLFAVMNPQTG